MLAHQQSAASTSTRQALDAPAAPHCPTQPPAPLFLTPASAPTPHHTPSLRRPLHLPPPTPPHPNPCLGAVAHASFLDSIHTTSNFGKLRVVTSAAHPDLDQMFGAGFLEGYLTAERIMDHHTNLHAYFVGTLNVSLEEPMEWCVWAL